MSLRRGLWYMSGGNPPHNAGIYLDGKIIAFWPVWIEPTEDRLRNIANLWDASDHQSAFGTQRVADELRDSCLL